MRFRVELSKRAEADLDRLLASLRVRSPKAAERLARSFRTALAPLHSDPFACGLAHESPDFNQELRHRLFWIDTKRKYRALFVVRGEVVHVVSIRAPGEKPAPSESIAYERSCAVSKRNDLVVIDHASLSLTPVTHESSSSSDPPPVDTSRM